MRLSITLDSKLQLFILPNSHNTITMAETPLRISERYSSRYLAGDYSPSSAMKRKRSTTPSQDMYGPRTADRPRLSTPDPRTPGIPSSVLTTVLTTEVSSVATAHSIATVLTVPDEKEEDDGIVRGVAVVDPFVRSEESSTEVVDGFDDGSALGDYPFTGRNEAYGVLESVEVDYGQAALSQQDRECYRPLAKRRKLDDAQPVSAIPGASSPDLEGNNGTDSGQEVQQGDTANKEAHDLEYDPDYETNSNWDHLEEVQDRLKEYNAFKKSIKGHEHWHPQQAKLHKLLALRGCWPMLEHSWALNFSIRNIYPQVFAPPPADHPNKRVAISSRTNEFRTTRALEQIFDLSALVCSYRQSRNEDKIGAVLRRALKHYVAWAAYDAGVEDRVYLPTLQVYEFDPRKWAAKVRRAAAAAAKPTAIPEIKQEPTSDSEEGGEEEEVDSDPISDEVDRRLRRLAARHRAALATPESRSHLPEEAWAYREPPPVLFAFVVVQHMLMVVSLDSSRPDAEIIVFSELDMSLADQWLWNALAVALPVHMARDALWERREGLLVAERVEVDDPDL